MPDTSSTPTNLDVPPSGRVTLPDWTGRRQIIGRPGRLALKELRETLRDRRTIITLVVMPLVLYPILALVFQRFLLTSLTSQGVVEYVIGVDSAHSKLQLEKQLRLGDAVLNAEHAADVSRHADTLALEQAPAPT